MKKIQFSVLFLVFTMSVFGQKQRITLQKQIFELHNVTGSIIKFEGKDVLKIERDLKALPLMSIISKGRLMNLTMPGLSAWKTLRTARLK